MRRGGRKGGGGGADARLMTCVVPYATADAPNWGDRTPGSQTPGVPATLGLDVQLDGIRKMSVKRANPHLRPTPRTSR